MQHTEQGLRPPFVNHGICKPPGGYPDNHSSQQTEVSWRHAAAASTGFNKAIIPRPTRCARRPLQPSQACSRRARSGGGGSCNACSGLRTRSLNHHLLAETFTTTVGGVVGGKTAHYRGRAAADSPRFAVSPRPLRRSSAATGSRWGRRAGSSVLIPTRFVAGPTQERSRSSPRPADIGDSCGPRSTRCFPARDRRAVSR